MLNCLLPKTLDCFLKTIMLRSNFFKHNFPTLANAQKLNF
jgi:hypothetical protein